MRFRLFVVLFVVVSTVGVALQAQQAPQAPTAQQAPGSQQAPTGGRGGGGRGAAPAILGPPAGMQALPLDLFLSKNFGSSAESMG